MSQLNVNNTDDLFRRASEEYPLRTDSSDWDRLSAALEKDPSMILPPTNENEDKRRRKRFFWLFFLLPLAGLGYYALHTRGGTPVTTPGATTATASTSGTTSGGQTADKQTADKQSADKQSGTGLGKTSDAPAGNTPADGSTATVSIPATTTDGKTAADPKTRTTEADPNVGKTAIPANNTSAKRTDGSSVSTPRNHNPLVRKRPSRLSDGTYVSAAGTNTPSGDPVATNSSSSDPTRTNTLSSDPATTKTSVPVGGTSNAPAPKPIVPTKKDDEPKKDAAVQKPAVTPPATTAATPAAPAPAIAKTKKQKGPSEHYFYAGVLIAPDLSMVKFQSVKKLGYTGGVLLGYQFNKRWSVETGVYIDKKQYNTEGQYFDKKNTPALWGLNVKNVDGYCNMVELPLNARYNLNVSEKRKWFVTTGLTTYLMYNENYNFEFLSNTGYPWNHSYTYKNPPQSWFSQISLSMGYEEKIGKIGNLRLEPYLRIPLAGIGTGSLPITSAGLNIGLIHSFR